MPRRRSCVHSRLISVDIVAYAVLQPCLCLVLLYENLVIAIEAGVGNTAFVVAINRGRFTVDGA